MRMKIRIAIALSILSILSIISLGCPMQNEFTGDLNSLLKDVPAFNAKYGNAGLKLHDLAWPAFEVKGLDLQGAAVSSMAFKTQRLSNSRFRNCRFEGVDFDGTVIEKSEFTDCSFNRCSWKKARFLGCRFHGGEITHGNMRFDEKEPGWTEFADSKFDGILIADTRLEKAGFDKAEFNHARFRNNDYEDASFTACVFRQPAFTEKQFKHLYMGSCQLEQPVFEGADLQDIQFETSTISGIQVKPAGNLKAYEPRGVAFKNSTFDLSQLRGSFALWGGQDCVIQNLVTKGRFGMRGSYSNVTVKNIQADMILLGNGSKFENCKFEGLQAGDIYMDKSTFTACRFSGLNIHEFMRLDSAEFHEVAWENAKTGAKLEYSAIGTIYESKRPF